jgi:hypothetical protein
MVGGRIEEMFGSDGSRPNDYKRAVQKEFDRPTLLEMHDDGLSEKSAGLEDSYFRTYYRDVPFDDLARDRDAVQKGGRPCSA